MIKFSIYLLSILALYGVVSGFSLNWHGCQHSARKQAYKTHTHGLAVDMELIPTYDEPTVINGISYQSRIFNIGMKVGV